MLIIFEDSLFQLYVGNLAAERAYTERAVRETFDSFGRLMTKIRNASNEQLETWLEDYKLMEQEGLSRAVKSFHKEYKAGIAYHADNLSDRENDHILEHSERTAQAYHEARRAVKAWHDNIDRKAAFLGIKEEGTRPLGTLQGEPGYRTHTEAENYVRWHAGKPNDWKDQSGNPAELPKPYREGSKLKEAVQDRDDEVLWSYRVDWDPRQRKWVRTDLKVDAR